MSTTPHVLIVDDEEKKIASIINFLTSNELFTSEMIDEARYTALATKKFDANRSTLRVIFIDWVIPREADGSGWLEASADFIWHVLSAKWNGILVPCSSDNNAFMLGIGCHISLNWNDTSPLIARIRQLLAINP